LSQLPTLFGVFLLIANSMAEVPALKLFAISAIEIPISYNTELPKSDSTELTRDL
jgi:hypothetical protein